MKNKILYLLIAILAFSVCSACRQKIEVANIDQECDFSIFQGLKPDMEEEDFFSVLGEPDEWFNDKNEYDSHCPIYYFDGYKLKGCWDGTYPEIGVIEFIPYNSNHYTIDQFLTNPEKYGIDSSTKCFDIYSNRIWYFEVFLDKKRVVRIQYWLEDCTDPVLVRRLRSLF